MIQPAQYGGYGKVEGEPLGGLEDRSFSSRCPPVVTRDTIIIAVCGPNDFENNASPDGDGWLFSDFYLFHHLFRGTAEQQYWMTCVHPRDLVKKYKEYAHGDPRSDNRRIVLDGSMENIFKDILVFNGKDLLEKFLVYITNASKQVKNTDQPILILIFGHAQAKAYSITIGGIGNFHTCPKLTRDKFREALVCHNPSPNVAMLTTACYGGGWVQSTFLNITAMAGVNHKEGLLSWPRSASLNRCCRSRYASGVAEALIENEIEGLSLATGEGEEILESPTYEALVAAIRHKLVEEIDVRESNDISFSAKDDIWGMEWRARTGFLPTNYQEKLESLKLVKKGDVTGPSQSASIRFSDTVTLSTPQAEHRLKRIAYEYVNSHPGPDAAAKNHFVHGKCGLLLQGVQLSDRDLERLAGALRYRMETIMGRATEYKDRLGISLPDCRDCDVYNYQAQVSKDKEKKAKRSQVYRTVLDRRLFDPPADHENMPYEKGNTYLTMVLTESGWDRQHIEAALDELVKLKGK